MLAGNVCAQWKKCGKPNCRCIRGELHGPYYYRFWWSGGRQHKSFVRKADVERVREACEAYRRYRAFRRESLAQKRQQMRYLQQLLASLRERESHVTNLRSVKYDAPH